MTFDGQDLLALAPEERAAVGVFLAMQYPVEIPGVANMYFMRQAMNAQRRARGEAEIGAGEFMKRLRAKAKVVGVTEELLKRDLNFGFSGGEKKRNEILQMAMIEPRLCILDETDSGLDIDALRTVADGVNALRDPARSIVVITHYQRLLDYIVPDQVHVLADGGIRRSGGKDLAHELEAAGYAGVLARQPREGLTPWPRPARAIEPLPAYGAVFANVEGQLPGTAPARLAPGRTGPVRRAGHPHQAGRGLEVHRRRQGGQRAAGGGAQGGDRPRCDRPLISWVATRRGG